MEGPRTEDRGQRTADQAEGGLRQGPGHLVVRKYSHAAPLEQIHSPTDLRLGCLGAKLSSEVCRKGLALERSGVLSAEQLGSDFLDSIRGIEWRMWHAISGWLTFAGFGTHWGSPMELINLSPQQLRKAADLKEKLQSLQRELDGLLGAKSGTVKAPAPPAPKRRLSAQGIANIRAGIKKRMAAAKRQNLQPKPAAQKKPAPMSPAQRKRLSDIAKARWAKARREGKASL